MPFARHQHHIGRSRLRLVLGAERAAIPVAAASALGGLLGASAAMRAVFWRAPGSACRRMCP